MSGYLDYLPGVFREDPFVGDFLSAFETVLTGADDTVGLEQTITRDREKPAHTFYALKIVVPTMRLVSEELRTQENDVPDLLVLGQNTLLGTSTTSNQ